MLRFRRLSHAVQAATVYHTSQSGNRTHTALFGGEVPWQNRVIYLAWICRHQRLQSVQASVLGAFVVVTCHRQFAVHLLLQQCSSDARCCMPAPASECPDRVQTAPQISSDEPWTSFTRCVFFFSLRLMTVLVPTFWHLNLTDGSVCYVSTSVCTVDWDL